MKLQKFLKTNKDILIEYVYDDGNLLGDAYKILVNSKDKTNTFISGDTSLTRNTQENSVFLIDAVTNKWGLSNTTNYSFLKTKDFGESFPTKYDTIKVHTPFNYNFGEYLGFVIDVWTFDSINVKKYSLAKFYYDNTDINKQYLLNYNTPPLLYHERLWGLNVTLQIPSVNAVSTQLENNRVKPNTINYNLTDGAGLSQTSPIFIDFYFIQKKSTINGVTTFLTTAPTQVSLPQVPEYKNIGIKVEESSQGDFFEIYGIYNDSLGEFAQFIDNSVALGNRYYVEYDVTLYEQNIRGKSQRFIVTDNFNETIEYRPIIKYSTTTAIIDVEMRVIDAVDDSQILRRASYGMYGDQLSKYALSLSKINLGNANKPKIYSIKGSISDQDLENRLKNSLSGSVRSGLGLGDGMTDGLFGDSSGLGSGGLGSGGSGLGAGSGAGGAQIQQVKVPFPVFINASNILAKSAKSAVYKKDLFHGIGKLQIYIYPFDNIIQFHIATKFKEDGTPDYMDLSKMGDIKLVIKNNDIITTHPLYKESEEINLVNGSVVFRVNKDKIGDVRKVYNSGVNLFYITSTSNSISTVIYTGTYKLFDALDNVSTLNQNSNTEAAQQAATDLTPDVVVDPAALKGKAIVTTKIIKTNNPPNTGGGTGA